MLGSFKMQEQRTQDYEITNDLNLDLNDPETRSKTPAWTCLLIPFFHGRFKSFVFQTRRDDLKGEREKNEKVLYFRLNAGAFDLNVKIYYYRASKKQIVYFELLQGTQVAGMRQTVTEPYSPNA